MRWPFSRRARAPREGTAAPVDAAPARSRGPRHWRQVPALRVTVDLRPPALLPVLRLPDVAGTRPVLRALPTLRHRPDRPAGTGRVTGLVSVPPTAPPAPTPLTAGPEPEPRPIPAMPAPAARVPDEPPAGDLDRRRFPVLPERTSAPRLVEATAEFVSEPVASEVPFQNVSEFDRLAAQYEEMGLETALGMLGLADLAGGGPVAPPPLMAEAAAPPVRGPLASRRPTLGESRRKGIGAARDRDDTADSPEPSAPDAEPPLVPKPAPPRVPRRDPVIPPRTPEPPAEETDPGLDHRTDPSTDHGIDPGEVLELPVAPSPPPERAEHSRPGEWTAPERAVPEPPKPLAAAPPRPALGGPKPGAAAVDEPVAPLWPRRTLAPRRSAKTPQQAVSDGDTGDEPGDRAKLRPASRIVHPDPAPASKPNRDNDSGSGEPLPAEPLSALVFPPTPTEPEQQAPEAPRTHEAPLVHPPLPHAENVVQHNESPTTTDVAPATETPIAAAGPVYRAVVGSFLAPVEPEVTVQATWPDSVETAVPADVVTVFHQQLGADVSRVPVHRGRAVAQRAKDLGARAFTQGGQVYLPGPAVPADDREGRALLAHELTHAVQQRALGGTLPAEESAEGRELEAAAVAVEQWFRGDGSAPPTLLHRPLTPAQTPSPSIPADLAAVLGNAVQRADSVLVAEPPAPSPAPGGATAWTPESGFTSDPAEVPAPPSSPSSWAPTPRTAGAPHADPAGLADAFRQIASLRESVADLRRPRPADPLAPVSMEQLARKLYGHIRARLRAELIVDRERAGTLADVR